MGKNLKLNIGCGDQILDGFVNIDVSKPAQKKIDVRRGLPYKNNSIGFIFSEHFIEHLSREESLSFLKECYRVLKPGGALRIATPDLDDMIQSYSRDTWNHKEWIHRFGYGWIPNRCVMLNVTLREWKHRHIFNYDDLKMVGNLAGFIIARRSEVRKSEFPELSGLEKREDSLVIEFLKEGEDEREKLPLVSIVIPAYNHRYLKECLRSALKQTYLNKEIILCNDNPSSPIRDIVKEVEDPGTIKYIENPQNIGAVANYTQCFEQARGSYIKFLNDDDLLAPHCVRTMVPFFEAFGERVSLVTSKRTRIDSQGDVLEDDVSTWPLVKEDSFIDGKDLGNFMLRYLKNILGEPTTIMFRKRALAGLKPTIFSISGKEISFNVDMVILLNLLSQGDAIYISEPLSCFRIHKDQEQQKPHVIYGCIEAWPHIVEHSKPLGFLEEQSACRQSKSTFLKEFKPWEENPLLTETQREKIKQMIADLKSELDLLERTAPFMAKKKKAISHFLDELKMIHEREGWNPPLRYNHIRSPLIKT